MDRSGIGNDPELVLLDVNSILVEGTFGSPHDVSHRSRVNRQDRGAEDHGQGVGAVGVSRVVEEDGELRDGSQAR